MPFGLDRIGQIALLVHDVDRAEAFYRDVLRLRKLFRFGDLTFFDCGGVRRLLDRAHGPDDFVKAAAIHFSCAEIGISVREPKQRGVTFTGEPHLIARMEDHDRWMEFFADPDGHTLALMHEAPKGFSPEPA